MLDFFFYIEEDLKPVKVSMLTALFSLIIQSHFHSLYLNVPAISNAVASRKALARVLLHSSVRGQGEQKQQHTWSPLVHQQRALVHVASGRSGEFLQGAVKTNSYQDFLKLVQHRGLWAVPPEILV